MREQAYRGLLALLDRKRTGEAELHRLVDAMDDPLVRSQQLDRVVRAEYTFAREALEGVANDPRGSGYRWVPMRAVYKENRTLHGLAEIDHQESVVQNLIQLHSMKTWAHLDDTASGRISEWIALLGGNWQGVDLVSSFVRDMVERQPSQPYPRLQIDRDEISGFVIRGDVLIAHLKDAEDKLTLAEVARPMAVAADHTPVDALFRRFISERHQIMLIVDEFGSTVGPVTFEDVIEIHLRL